MVTRSQLRQILDIKDVSIGRYDKEGMPCVTPPTIGRGKEATYRARDVIDWMIERQVAKVSGGKFIAEKERGRLLHHQANRASLEEDVLNDILISSDEVARELENAFTIVKTRILAASVKAAAEVCGLENINKIKEIIDSYLYEALEELSTYDEEQVKELSKKGLSKIKASTKNNN